MHRLCLTVMALLVGAAVSNAYAQPVTPGIVSSPCPPPDPAAEARLKAIDDLFMTPAASPEVFWADFAKLQATVPAGDAERNRARQLSDWPNLCRYKATTGRSPMDRALAPSSWATRSPTNGGQLPPRRCISNPAASTRGSGYRGGSMPTAPINPAAPRGRACRRSECPQRSASTAGALAARACRPPGACSNPMTQTALMPVACANIRLVEPSALAVPVGEADDVV